MLIINVLHAKYYEAHTLQVKAEKLGLPPAQDGSQNLVATHLHLHVHYCFIAHFYDYLVHIHLIQIYV